LSGEAVSENGVGKNLQRRSVRSRFAAGKGRRAKGKKGFFGGKREFAARTQIHGIVQRPFHAADEGEVGTCRNWGGGCSRRLSEIHLNLGPL